jgi:hypothetical protein
MHRKLIQALPSHRAEARLAIANRTVPRAHQNRAEREISLGMLEPTAGAGFTNRRF